jgi:hypothetical protein
MLNDVDYTGEHDSVVHQLIGRFCRAVAKGWLPGVLEVNKDIIYKMRLENYEPIPEWREQLKYFDDVAYAASCEMWRNKRERDNWTDKKFDKYYKTIEDCHNISIRILEMEGFVLGERC